MGHGNGQSLVSLARIEASLTGEGIRKSVQNTYIKVMMERFWRFDLSLSKKLQ